jgi:hypothetical protein
VFDNEEVTAAALQFVPGPVRGQSVLEAGNVGAGKLVGRIDGLARRAAPPLPVAPALAPVLPEGIRRGSTVAVRGSVSLLLALLGTASREGAWSALIGLPAVSVEAAAEYGVDAARLAFVPDPGAEWSTAVGALVDAVDLVVVRPPANVPEGVVRRLAARARSKDAVLLPYLSAPGSASAARWPGADVTVSATPLAWTGVDGGEGHGRLRGRQVTVSATGRGRNAAPRTTRCWLPAPFGAGVSAVDTLTTVHDRPDTAVRDGTGGFRAHRIAS